MSEQDAVERLPVDTIRGRLRLEVNRFDTKMHMTNRDVSLRQTLMQAEQALEASQQEVERLRGELVEPALMLFRYWMGLEFGPKPSDKDVYHAIHSLAELAELFDKDAALEEGTQDE